MEEAGHINLTKTGRPTGHHLTSFSGMGRPYRNGETGMTGFIYLCEGVLEERSEQTGWKGGVWHGEEGKVLHGKVIAHVE